MAKVLTEMGAIDLATFVPPAVVKANTSHTLSVDDMGCFLQCTNAAAVTLTIPASKSGKIPIGATISVLQDGVGKVTFAPATGVTLNAPTGALGTSARYAVTWAQKIDIDRWIIGGNLG